MVSLVLPVLMMVRGKVELLPTATLPNARLVGFACSPQSFTPCPPTGKLSVLFEALLVNVTAPFTFPTTVGANVTVKFTPWPADSVCGTAKLLTVNTPLLTLKLVTVTDDAPVLVMVNGRVWVWPGTH